MIRFQPTKRLLNITLLHPDGRLNLTWVDLNFYLFCRQVQFNSEIYDQMADRSLINQVATIFSPRYAALICEVWINFYFFIHVGQHYLITVIERLSNLDFYSSLLQYLADNALFKRLTQV